MIRSEISIEMQLLDEIKLQFGRATGLFRLLAINIGVFLVITLARTFLFLFTGESAGIDWLVGKLSLPASPELLLYQPWSLLTYMFLHADLLHILFNMLILYWTGRLFTEYLGNDKLWATYVLGGLVGGFLYLVSFNLFPAFSAAKQYSFLLGASAGVIAVLVAVATLLPDYIVHLLLIGPVRLKYVAIISILLYFISIPLGNAGGHIAHLGGALFGYLMIVRLRSGSDLTSWLTGLGKRKKAKMKVVSRQVQRGGTEDTYHDQNAASQEAIDRILDKINRSGFDSLTKQEKEILYKASGKN